MSATLRRKALRQLWRFDPVFANVDRLNDYDENFADPSRVMATLQSAWQAGRGYVFPEEGQEPGPDGTDALARSTADDGDGAFAGGPEAEAETADDIDRPAEIGRAAADMEVADPGHEGDAEEDRVELPARLSLRARLGV